MASLAEPAARWLPRMSPAPAPAGLLAFAAVPGPGPTVGGAPRGAR